MTAAIASAAASFMFSVIAVAPASNGQTCPYTLSVGSSGGLNDTVPASGLDRVSTEPTFVALR